MEDSAAPRLRLVSNRTVDGREEHNLMVMILILSAAGLVLWGALGYLVYRLVR